MHYSRAMSPRTRRVLFVIVATTIVLAGCTGSGFSPLRIKDRAAIAEVRIGKTFYTGDHTDAGVEVGATRINGSNSQIPDGQVRLGNTRFVQPETLSTTFHSRTYDASLRYRQFSSSLPVGYEVRAGFAYADLNIAGSSPTGHDSESIEAPFLRTKSTFDSAAGGLSQYFSRLNLSVVRNLGRYVNVQGGYTRWQINAPSEIRSLIDLRISGPSVGLNVNF